MSISSLVSPSFKEFSIALHYVRLISGTTSGSVAYDVPFVLIFLIFDTPEIVY